MLMHRYGLIILFLLYACDDPTSSEIPPIYGDSDSMYNYNMNLHSENSGQYADYATINWTPYQNYTEDFISYVIKDENGILFEITDLETTSYQMELTPESFTKLYMEMNADSQIITDSIHIFTRPIEPVTQFTAIANSDNWFTSLNWNSSDETESQFSHYNIYRGFENHEMFDDLENCNCMIHSINTQNTKAYIDSVDLVWGGGYYYLIETVTNDNYLRNSTIKSNIVNPSYSPQINNDNTYASDSEYNKISIHWSHNLGQNQFYSLEIWRSNAEDISPFNQTKLISITDHNKNNFEDYYEIGDGLSWFYKLRLTDIYGNTHDSNTIIGSSRP